MSWRTRPRHVIGGYREFAPPPEAAFFCEAFWAHAAPAGPQIPGAAHRVLPDPALSVAVASRRGTDGRTLQNRIVLIGPKTRAQIFSIVAGEELAAVRLKLEWTAPILGIDPLSLDGQFIDLGEIAPRVAGELADHVSDVDSPLQMQLLVARAVLANRVSNRPPASAVSIALDRIRSTRGRQPCDGVARFVGVSERHLRRLVRDASGLSLKSHARALRLAMAMQLADAVDRPEWAGIAARAGYCDQSHLIRECAALAGVSPSVLRHERRRQRVAMSEISNPC